MPTTRKGEPGLASNLTELEKNARMTLETERLKIELQELRGNLISRQEARDAFVNVILAARARLLTMPASVAARLAAESDPAVVEALLRDTVETILREMAEHGVTTGI